ncbi:unnamed protein product [Zymoseptoria tritici ST99CH_3D7]|uniref:DOMON domain-containing protein n=1 Tax=Zymoseptoria tritici (strain ST99CH_3D7) TaxID=1276538 RepID=A0A1X7RYL5_ZYMT9|nr:unnamed protein product [Zymoseptoria tritici ST99CH_3D7]
MKASAAIMTALALVPMSSASYMTRQCFDANAVCFTLNVPGPTAQSGSGDIFFQMTAPTSMNWVGLGQGSKMAGSNMFVMYTSSDGQNVTISPRLGMGHEQPLYDNAANFTLLDGSGVQNGNMTANVKCSNCNSWSGGSMDFTGSTAEWIYGYKDGAEMNSDAEDARIKEHSKYGSFSFNLTQARGGNSANPFTDQAYTVDNIPLVALDEAAYPDTLLTAHGVVACAAILLFILGAILIRLASFSGLVWAHVGVQVFGFVAFIAAVGMGIYMAMFEGFVAHPIIGLIVFGLLFVQPITGLVHHRLFKRTNARSASSWVHLTTGRSIIILGLINGGLGLQLAGQSRAVYIAYGVVAGVVGLVYLAAIIFGERKRSSTRSDSSQSTSKSAFDGSKMEQSG